MRFSEDNVLKFLHHKTYVPGVVRVIHSGYAEDKEGNPIKENHPLRGPRQLFRILFADVGRPLSSCMSVYQFLRVMHDALSAQINATGVVGVLHRHITDQTIQVKISSGNPVEKEKYKPETLIAPYIKELLGDVKPEDDVGQLAECVITDFEDSLILVKGHYEEEIKKTMGTPMFLSRSVARATLLPVERTMTFPPIPRLDGKNPLFEKYRSSKDMPHNYQNYNNLQGYAFGRHVNNKHNPKEKGKDEPVEPPAFEHLLVHEAESTLWVITSWLIHAIPVSSACTAPGMDHPAPDLDAYTSSDAYHRICQILYLDPPESRDLIPAASEWRKFLHPLLASSLVTMLAEMHRYLRPEWALFPMADLRPDHAHEALRRLIFKEIVRMKDAGEIGEVQKARRAVPHDILTEVRQREQHADILAVFGKSMNPLGRPMGKWPMPGDSKEDAGYGGRVYLFDEEVDDEDEERGDDMDQDQDQGTPKETTVFLPAKESVQSQAQVDEEDKIDTD